MFGLKRIVIAQHERALYLKDRSIVEILEPGIYRVFDLLGRVAVEVHNLTVPEFNHPYVDVLVKESRDLVDKYFQLVELGEYEVGLVYKNGKLNGVLAPGTRQLYWKGPVDVKVEVAASNDRHFDKRLRFGNLELKIIERGNLRPVRIIGEGQGARC